MAYSTVQQSPQTVADILGGADREFYGAKTVADIRERFGHKGNPLLSSFVIPTILKWPWPPLPWGLPSASARSMMLVTNGAMLGGIAGAFAKSGIGGQLWMVILPHGALELSAVVSPAARACSGLQPLVSGPADAPPGTPRGGRAGHAVGRGSDPRLRMAGIFEGFVTPSDAIPESLKVILGVAVAVVFWLYLLLAGRGALR